jgi:hypothetical protein
MQRVVPALRVKSFPTSMEFYSRLGFVKEWVHQFEPGLPVFASIGRDGMEINLTEHSGDCQFGGLIHFYIPDVDSYYKQIRENGIPVEQPPTNSLGPDLRDMVVVDPDGNRLLFLTRSSEPAAK